MFTITEFLHYLSSYGILIILSGGAYLFFNSKVLQLRGEKKQMLSSAVITLGFLLIAQSVTISFKANQTVVAAELFFVLLDRLVLFAAVGAFVWKNAKRTSAYKILLNTSLAIQVSNIAQLLAMILVISISQKNVNASYDHLFAQALYFSGGCLTFGFVLLFLRTRIVTYLRDVLKNPPLSIRLFCLTVLAEAVFTIPIYIVEYDNFWFILINGVMLILFSFYLIIGFFYTKDISRSVKLEHTSLLLLQQQTYTKHLEEIQQKLRGIQHDHKNLIAGLYVHAKEGNYDQIQKYIEGTLFKVDVGIEDQIKWSNQLGCIESVELKGLLLTKFLMAKQNNITLNLEVESFVDKIEMDMGDFIRCVGILLDNALEAVQQDNEKSVDIILLKEEKVLSLVVKNPCKRKLNVAKLKERGFSTKGENRGLGLATYREILDTYANTLTETRQQEGEFIQELAIIES